MNLRADALLHVLFWLCDELVRALLWGAWRHVLARKGDAQDRAFRRFNLLVNRANLWPCCVEWQHPRTNEERFARGDAGSYRPPLCITSGPAADFDLWEDFS